MGRTSSELRRALPWGVALALWVCFVWGHSLVGGVDSSLESGRFVALLKPVFESLGVTDVDLMTFVVRKCAHFSEYAVLGVFSRTFWTRAAAVPGAPRRLPLAGGVATVLVPCVDETIQLFVPGRCGSVRDVLIDLAGCATGVVLCRLFRHIRDRFVAR